MNASVRHSMSGVMRSTHANVRLAAKLARVETLLIRAWYMLDDRSETATILKQDISAELYGRRNMVRKGQHPREQSTQNTQRHSAATAGRVSPAHARAMA